MEKKFLTIFGRGMCNDLIRRGFNVVEVKKDNMYPERTVFFFANSPEIKAAINEIKKYREV